MKTELEKDLNFINFFGNRKNIIAVALLVVLLIALICIGVGVDFKQHPESIEQETIEETPTYIVSSASSTPEDERTDLEKLGIQDNMFVGTNGKTVCANCSKPLSVYDKQITMVLTQDASFIKIVLCKDCFIPLSELLATIGVI